MAQFGPAPTSERRLNFAQAFNPPGTIVGVGQVKHPVGWKRRRTGGFMKAAGTYVPYLVREIMAVVPTYIAVRSAARCRVLCCRGCFPANYYERTRGRYPVYMKLRGVAALSAALFAGGECINVGAQIRMWSNSDLHDKQYTPVGEKTAANYIIYSLAAMLAGQFCRSTPLMEVCGAVSLLLGIYGVANVGLMIRTAASRGQGGGGARGAIVAASFFPSIMFPTIFARHGQ